MFLRVCAKQLELFLRMVEPVVKAIPFQAFIGKDTSVLVQRLRSIADRIDPSVN